MIDIELAALQFAVRQLSQLGSSSTKRVVRNGDGQIDGLVEQESRPRDPLAVLEDAAGQVERLSRDASRMTDQQALAFRVAFIGLTEAAERCASAPLHARFREQGDRLRRALRRDGVTLEPWYR